MLLAIRVGGRPKKQWMGWGNDDLVRTDISTEISKNRKIYGRKGQIALTRNKLS